MVLLVLNLLYIFLHEDVFIYIGIPYYRIIPVIFAVACVLLVLIIFVEPFLIFKNKSISTSEKMIQTFRVIVYSIFIFFGAFMFNGYFYTKYPDSPVDILGKNIQIPKDMSIEEVYMGSYSPSIDFTELERRVVWKSIKPIPLQTESVRYGSQSMALYQNHEFTYTVAGYLNPKASGSIYFKAFEPVSGMELHFCNYFKTKKEYQIPVKWSTRKKEQFLFVSPDFCIEEGGADYKFPVKIEIWFNPADTTQDDRLLISKIYRINGWDWRLIN